MHLWHEIFIAHHSISLLNVKSVNSSFILNVVRFFRSYIITINSKSDLNLHAFLWADYSLQLKADPIWLLCQSSLTACTPFPGNLHQLGFHKSDGNLTVQQRCNLITTTLTQFWTIKDISEMRSDRWGLERQMSVILKTSSLSLGKDEGGN